MLTALINCRSVLQVDIASGKIPAADVQHARARMASLDKQINAELSFIGDNPEYVPSESDDDSDEDSDDTYELPDRRETDEEHHLRTCTRAQLAKKQGHVARRLSFDLEDWEQTCAAMIAERDAMIKDIDDWWPEPNDA